MPSSILPDVIEPDRILPRLVANGRTPDERPKSSEENAAQLRQDALALGSSNPVGHVFAGYISIVYLFEWKKDQFIWVTQGDIDRWRVTESDLFDIAVSNLRNIKVGETEHTRFAAETGYFYFNMASSLILLGDEFWRSMGMAPEKLVVGCPVREILLYDASGDPRRRGGVAQVISNYWNDDDFADSQRISDDFLVRDTSAPSGWAIRPTSFIHN